MIDKIKADLKDAMKRKDEVTLSTLRMLMADVKNALVAGERKETIADDEVIALVQRGAKRRREAAQQFEAAGRQDLADKEKAELAVLEDYLPQQLSGDDLEAIVDEAIAAAGATTKRDMGKVMGQIMGKYKGQVDGKMVQQLVSSKLV